jgi:hypothetical protein
MCSKRLYYGYSVRCWTSQKILDLIPGQIQLQVFLCTDWKPCLLSIDFGMLRIPGSHHDLEPTLNYTSPLQSSDYLITVEFPFNVSVGYSKLEIKLGKTWNGGNIALK